MLDCRHHRLDYGDLLKPPEGYLLDRGVAATYSVDLKTLLSIPVALVYAQTLEDGDLEGERFQLLEAIKQTSNKVKVYHQKGQLHVPQAFNWLYTYMEDVLAPVLLDNAFSVFHPKVWVLRYLLEQTGEVCYRVIVLSRNLTFDRNWDVAVFLEGKKADQKFDRNQPLAEFLHWLCDREPFDGSDRFIFDLEQVNFRIPEGFEDYAFHPIGIPEYEQNPVVHQQADQTLAMSPFLHEKALRILQNNTDKAFHLFSESNELERLPVEYLEQCSAYCLSDLIVDGERLNIAEEGNRDVQEQHLHGKLYLFQKGGDATWFIGSANVTQAALSRNVEFLLELKGDSTKTRIRTLLKELVGPQEGSGPFVPFEPARGGQDDLEKRRRQAAIRRFEHALLSADIRGRVVPSENTNNFDLYVNFDLGNLPDQRGLTVTVQSFHTDSASHKISPGKVEEVCFANISEVNLSRFLHVRIEENGQLCHAFLLRIQISGLPPTRMENIFKKIIDSQDKFFQYLRFLLADEITKEDLLASTEDAIGEEQKPGKNQEYLDPDGWHLDIPIYEQLLVAASRYPRKLIEIDGVIRHLQADDEDNSVIPEPFLHFWEIFRSVIPIDEEKSHA